MDPKLSTGEEGADCRLSGEDKKHHKQRGGGTVKSVGKEKVSDS